jgi:uncharacterized membrane protein
MAEARPAARIAVLEMNSDMILPAKPRQSGMPALQTRLNNLRISGAEIFLLILMLGFGALMVFTIPVGGGYDEDTHLVRVWTLSDFSFAPRLLPARQLLYPAIFEELSYRNKRVLRPVEPGFWQKYGGLKLFAHGYFYGPLGTRSTYSPPLLLPQALVMRYLGRKADLPALVVFYACRLAGLLCYTALAWLAVRTVPFGKWPLAVLALAPMAVFQAATINADAISNGIGLLFTAGCLMIAERRQAGWKEWGILVLLFSLLFLAKANLVPLALLPFIIIRPSYFRNRGMYLLLLAAAGLLFVVEVGGWYWIVNSDLSSPSRGVLQGADPAAQLKHILANPLVLIRTLLEDLRVHGRANFLQWVGVYGYGYFSPPQLTYPLFLLGLCAAVLIHTDARPPSRSVRIALLVVFLLSSLATLLAIYILYVPAGAEIILGVQGRYFIALTPLLFLSFSEMPEWPAASPKLAAGLAAAALFLYALGMLLSYHVTCGTSFYTTGLCYQPNFRNWAPYNPNYSPPISGGMEYVQVIRPECSGVTELKVWVDAQGAGATEFLLEDPFGHRDLARKTVPNSELPQGDWLTLSFDPDWQATQKLYMLHLRGIDAPPGQGIRVAFTYRPNEYDLGNMYLNGARVDDNLLFKYGCITGLRKMLPAGPP